MLNKKMYLNRITLLAYAAFLILSLKGFASNQYDYRVWIVKNNDSIYYGTSNGCISYSSLQNMTFTGVQGNACAIARSPVYGNGTEADTKNQIWHVGKFPNNNYGALCRLETVGGWVTHNIIIGGTTIKAWDIASYGNYYDTVKVWAVGDSIGAPKKKHNMYKYNNSTGMWDSVQGMGTKVDISPMTLQPWQVNKIGDVWELVTGSGWVKRNYYYRQAAIDIGCGITGSNYKAIFIATSQGKLMRYTSGTSWVVDTMYNNYAYNYGKRAKAVDASGDIAAVVNTDGTLYFVKDNYYAGGQWCVRALNISNAKDVSFCADPCTGLGSTSINGENPLDEMDK